MGKFDNYIFRCSQLGKIMSAKGDLTQSNKTALLEIYIEETTGYRKEITSKYFEKGKYMEQDGISLLNQVLYPNNLLVKNKERKTNDFVSGECDSIAPDNILYDIKNAWDQFTFGKASLTEEYEWQLRGYMWLWGVKHSRLFYCLNNMPEHLLCDEERKLSYKFLTTDSPDYIEAVQELRDRHNYDKMDLWQRFKFWDVEHDEVKISELKKKIAVCRSYLDKIDINNEFHYMMNKSVMGINVLTTHHDKEVNATIVQ